MTRNSHHRRRRRSLRGPAPVAFAAPSHASAMGIRPLHPGTVVGAMVDAPEPDPGETNDQDHEGSTAPRRTRRLDRRTVAICACIALIAAVAAGLITSI